MWDVQLGNLVDKYGTSPIQAYNLQRDENESLLDNLKLLVLMGIEKNLGLISSIRSYLWLSVNQVHRFCPQ
jgi:hypothetical protein